MLSGLQTTLEVTYQKLSKSFSLSGITNMITAVLYSVTYMDLVVCGHQLFMVDTFTIVVSNNA